MTERTKPAQPQLPHKLILDERHALTVTGVTEVLRFDERGVALKTVKGLLLLRGEGLQLRQLAPENGQVMVQGQLTALSYEELRGGFLRRLFG